MLHGGKTQDQREAGIKGFRDDTYNILIATDVAGRGVWAWGWDSLVKKNLYHRR